MTTIPACPECTSEYVYIDQDMYTCPECAHEWLISSQDAPEDDEETFIVKDAYGTILSDGDSVSVIKDLKIKGASSVVKSGTKVKNIRLVDSDHNIDCSIAGVGSMGLKSEFVKKL